MAVTMFICRTPTPDKAADKPISLQEWKAVVRDAPQMHLFEGTESLPGHVLSPSSAEGLARWSGHPDGTPIWFHYDNGLIRVEEFDPYISLRARYLASYLNARVMGPRGQVY